MSSPRLLPIVTVIVLSACAHHSPRTPTSGPPLADGAAGAAASAEATSAEAESTAVVEGENPLLRASTLPFQAPPFDRIADSDYAPALEEGMRRQIVEVERIADQSDPPTFENTIVALERSGELLDRASNVFFGVTQANTNDTLQAIQTEFAPRLAAHSDSIHLNAKLFQRVQRIYDERDQPGLDAAQKHLVERYHRDFVRAGALLSEADKARLRELNQEESKLSTDFHNRLLAATRAGALVLDDSSQLAGLSAGDIAAAADAAKERGLEGKWVIPLQNTTQQPA
ncbi:MAG TPA: hypothetical protein VF178_04955, partial [Gemmatimonadaceae bacterium]